VIRPLVAGPYAYGMKQIHSAPIDRTSPMVPASTALGGPLKQTPWIGVVRWDKTWLPWLTIRMSDNMKLRKGNVSSIIISRPDTNVMEDNKSATPQIGCLIS